MSFPVGIGDIKKFENINDLPISVHEIKEKKESCAHSNILKEKIKNLPMYCLLTGRMDHNSSGIRIMINLSVMMKNIQNSFAPTAALCMIR